MHKGKKILALIPARGASKRLPGKNIMNLCGKPLIGWTIEEALKSRYVDKVIVSTDCKKIADIAGRFKAEAPFIRPKSLSGDSAKSVDVVLHALDWLEKRGEEYDLILLLQPTSPLRIARDIDNAIRLLFSKKAQAIVSVCEAGHHPYWTNVLPEDGSLKNFMRRTSLNLNKQSLPNFYMLNGAIYLAERDYLKKRRALIGDGTFAYIMPRERSLDIDEAVDLAVAETLIKKRKCR